MSLARFVPEAARPAVPAAALLVASQVAGKATRDALFLSSFDVSALPAMSAGAALVSLFATFAFSRALSTLSPARLLPVALGASAALFLGEWALTLAFPPAGAIAVYLHHAILGAVLLSGFWSLVNERFDPHRAKQAMGAIGAGASLGGVAGGVLTWVAASLVSVPSMLGVLAGTSLLGLMTVLRLRVAGAPSWRADPSAAPGAEARASGLRLIRALPYLRDLALLVALCAFLEAVLDYLLGVAAVARFGRGAPLMSFFALFHAGSGFLALLAQAAFVNAALHRLGLAGTLAVQPAFTAVGALLALASPRLAVMALLRGGQAVLRNSTFRSSYELLYTPLPPEQKRPTKVLVDVGCDRLGTVAGSGAVMLVLLLAGLDATRALLVLTAAVAAASLMLALRFRSGYVGALAASLRTGGLTLDPMSVVDPSALMTLASVQRDVPLVGRDAPPAADPLLEKIAHLRSGDRGRVAAVLDGRELDPRLVGHAIPLLVDDAIFAAVARSLRQSAAGCTGQLVDALLDPGLDPAVRRRVARILRGVPSQRAADGLLQGLDDERFDIRYRCAQALGRQRARRPGLAIPEERVRQIALREAADAGRSARHLEHVFAILALVLDAEGIGMALRALRHHDDALQGTALEYLDNVLPIPIREKLFPHLAGARKPERSGLSADEVRDELLRSVGSLPGKPTLASTSRGPGARGKGRAG